MNRLQFPTKWKTPLIWLAAGAGVFFILRLTVLAPPAVRIVNMMNRDLTAQVYGNGTMEAKVVVAVSSKVTGRIQELYADQGDRVKAGQLLARLEDEDLKQQVLQARAGTRKAASGLSVEEANYHKALASLDLAVSNARRIEDLGAKNLASRQDVELQATTLQVARKEVERAKAALEAMRMDELAQRANTAFAESRHNDMLIMAPQDGVIISRDLEKGAMVSPGLSIFRLVDPAIVWVKANVDESKRQGIVEGLEAAIHLRSASGERFHGRVARVGIESDRVTEEFEVDVAFDPPLKEIRIGEQAEVYITTAVKKGVPSLPAGTVTSRGKKRAVWTVENDRLRAREIVAGIVDRAGFVEVLSGMGAEAAVVTAPPEMMMGFKEGMRVKVEK